MEKILVVHNRYKHQGGEDIAVESEINALKNLFEVKTLIFENNEIDIFSDLFNFIFNKNFKSAKKLNNILLVSYNPLFSFGSTFVQGIKYLSCC